MNPHANTINNVLSAELLWAIFFMNAAHDDATAKERVQITITSTHVCKAWRILLLDAASIWGQLIYVEHKERKNDKEIDMMHEILRRSGESPLNVHAVLRNYRTGEGYRKLLDHVLVNYWPRIKCLEIRFAGTMRRSHKNHFLSHLTRPSALLCACHIQVDFQWTVVPAPNYEIGPSPPLFGGMAPNLHYLRGDYLAISPKASWLSGLTTLITNYHSKLTSSAFQTLGMLSSLPQLSHLELLHRMAETIPDLATISSHALVHLPNLKYLAVAGIPENCLTLVDRIQRPSTCLVNVAADLLHYSHETQNLSVIAQRLFGQTFLKNLKLLNQLNSLSVGMAAFGMILTDNHCLPIVDILDIEPKMSPSVNYFSVRPLFAPYARGEGVQILQYLFQPTVMGNVTTLRLAAPHQALYPGFLESLLLNADRVRTLELDSVNTLLGLCEHDDPSSPSFPKLEILCIALWSPYEGVEYENEDDDPAKNKDNRIFPIVTFLGPRKIKTLRVYSAFPSYWHRVFKWDTRMTEILQNTKLELLHDADGENDDWYSEESYSDGEYSEGEE